MVRFCQFFPSFSQDNRPTWIYSVFVALFFYYIPNVFKQFCVVAMLRVTYSQPKSELRLKPGGLLKLPNDFLPFIMCLFALIYPWSYSGPDFPHCPSWPSSSPYLACSSRPSPSPCSGIPFSSSLKFTSSSSTDFLALSSLFLTWLYPWISIPHIKMPCKIACGTHNNYPLLITSKVHTTAVVIILHILQHRSFPWYILHHASSIVCEHNLFGLKLVGVLRFLGSTLSLSLQTQHLKEQWKPGGLSMQ